MPAQAEQLEPVRVDAVVAASLDLGDGLRERAVLDLRRATAAGADDVVVVGRSAPDVRVLARRQVDALEQLQLGQEVERPEERRAADAEPARPRDRGKVGRGEMAVLALDQLGEGESRGREPVARAVEGVDDRVLIGHASEMILDLSTAARVEWPRAADLPSLDGRPPRTDVVSACADTISRMERPPAADLTATVRSFLDAPNYATLATVGEDGTPHQAVIWYRLEARDRILVNSRTPRRWPDELRRDGRASLAVTDIEDPFRWVGLQVVVEKVIDDVATAREDIVALAVRYAEDDEESVAKFRTQERISFRLRILAVHEHLDE